MLGQGPTDDPSDKLWAGSDVTYVTDFRILKYFCIALVLT